MSFLTSGTSASGWVTFPGTFTTTTTAPTFYPIGTVNFDPAPLRELGPLAWLDQEIEETCALARSAR